MSSTFPFCGWSKTLAASARGNDATNDNAAAIHAARRSGKKLGMIDSFNMRTISGRRHSHFAAGVIVRR
ncbi:MAG: hypothetical protein JNL58_32440 [Planctomyces sp.]|nr:hypothetical protein [Planctomyces sp.]